MKAASLRWAVLIAALSLTVSCGKSNNNTSPAVCTQTANMTLYTSSSATMILSSITVTAQYQSTVPSVPVWVGYLTPPVGAILAGYPADGVDPLNFGIDIIQNGPNTDNPLEFLVTFNTARSPATYHAVLRFVAADQAFTAPVDCQDVPVAFTIS